MEARDADPPARRVRVALIGCTGILGELIGRTVRDDPALDVAASLQRDALSVPEGQSPELDADIVVWHEADELEVAHWLSRAHPAPRVLATLHDGRDASLWQLAPRRTRLGEVSPAAILETIRAGSARPEPDPGSEPEETR
ncbi:hypothetical protein [Nocardioides sp. cx-173]|uniref:hypothetical protein n=1 Tax=Nocardioides sp. cx-173 TaxID=2898796 RepID=UPI001E5FAD62|nr:hypothetical protein [Nocardioides sp. cx-173]MCD4525957.1 hypothetical protein [Nocardioides sp. cx-173]UGB43654.1 hypothetical protein LQ940_09045 [Nocardioides sp. cx-173]